MVFIYGPPAVGKLTVAQELSKVTGYRYFSNHQASDPVRAILDFDQDPAKFRRVANDVKHLIIEKAIELDLPGLIMTFCYSRPDGDYNLKNIMSFLKERNVNTYFTRLHCTDEALFARVEDPSRRSGLALKITEVDKLRAALKKHGFKDEIPYVESFSIDNTRISPEEAARQIAQYHSFPTNHQPTKI